MKKTLLTFLLLLIYNLSAFSQTVFSGIKLPDYSNNNSENQKRGVVARCDSAYEFNLDKKINRKFYFFYDKNKFIKEQHFVMDTITQKFRLNFQKVYDYDLNGNLLSSKNYDWNNDLNKISLIESIDYEYTTNAFLAKKIRRSFQETSIIASAFNPIKKTEEIYKSDGQNYLERVTIESSLNQSTQKYNQSFKKEEYEYDNNGNILTIKNYTGDSLLATWKRTNQFITRKFNDKNQLIYTLDSTANMEGYPVPSLRYTIYKKIYKYNNKNQVIAIDRFWDDNHTSATKLESRSLYEYEPLKETFFSKQLGQKDLDTINPYEVNYRESKNNGNHMIADSYFFKNFDTLGKITYSEEFTLTIDNNYSIIASPLFENDIDPIKEKINSEFNHIIDDEIKNSISHKKVISFDNNYEGLTELYYSNIETASISNIDNSAISIYPNPSNGSFTLKSTSTMIGKPLNIIDITGRSVYAGVINATTQNVSMENIENGTYFLSVDNKEAIKLIKE
jgi:hypothetical protein